MASSNNIATLGDIYVGLGRYAEAVDRYRKGVRLLRGMQQTYYLADGLVLLAKAHIAAGECEQARVHLAEALSIYEEHGRTETDEVRELLVSVSNVMK